MQMMAQKAKDRAAVAAAQQLDVGSDYEEEGGQGGQRPARSSKAKAEEETLPNPKRKKVKKPKAKAADANAKEKATVNVVNGNAEEKESVVEAEALVPESAAGNGERPRGGGCPEPPRGDVSNLPEWTGRVVRAFDHVTMRQLQVPTRLSRRQRRRRRRRRLR
jgi:hypothetical protein